MFTNVFADFTVVPCLCSVILFFNEIFRHSLRYGRHGSRCTWLCRLRLVCCSVYPCLTENSSVMICLYAMRILKGYRMCDMVSEMPVCTVYSLCRRKTCAFVCFSSCSRSTGRFVEETRPFSCRHFFYRISCQSQRDWQLIWQNLGHHYRQWYFSQDCPSLDGQTTRSECYPGFK